MDHLTAATEVCASLFRPDWAEVAAGQGDDDPVARADRGQLAERLRYGVQADIGQVVSTRTHARLPVDGEAPSPARHRWRPKPPVHRLGEVSVDRGADGFMPAGTLRGAP